MTAFTIMLQLGILTDRAYHAKTGFKIISVVTQRKAAGLSNCTFIWLSTFMTLLSPFCLEDLSGKNTDKEGTTWAGTPTLEHFIIFNFTLKKILA